MPTAKTTTRRLARHYDLPLQSATLLYLLIAQEYIDAVLVEEQMGQVDLGQMVHRLRTILPDTLEIHSGRSLGYWFDSVTRVLLGNRFDIEVRNDVSSPP